MAHYPDEQLKTNFIRHISQQLHHKYSYLSNLFSETEGITTEKYFILQEIEKAKEMLMYDGLCFRNRYKIKLRQCGALIKPV